MQYESLDDRTRLALYNLFCNLYYRLFEDMYSLQEKEQFWNAVFSKVYTQTLDYGKNYKTESCLNIIKTTILSDDYDSVLSLVEFTFYIFEQLDRFEQLDVEELLNQLLKEEFVGYRYVGKMIVPISNEEELKSIDDVLSAPYDNATGHLKKAIQLFSDRKNPDYENSIKESITAVESMCILIAGEKGTLSQCLSKLKEKGLNIHPAMEKALKHLYGYTSDATGIRHAGDIGGPSSTFSDAKFMLVTCSAFINYLREVAAEQEW